jgi:hypothetical protein
MASGIAPRWSQPSVYLKPHRKSADIWILLATADQSLNGGFRLDVTTTPISIRLAKEQIAAAKKIAARKSVGYPTQLRMWIAEGIRRESKRA